MVEIDYDNITSYAVALYANCPVCWAFPGMTCLYIDYTEDDIVSLAYAIPQYHWMRLERAERHLPGIAREVYLNEISSLRLIDLIAIAFRRIMHEQVYPLANLHIDEHTSRDAIIAGLLPGGNNVTYR